MSASIERLPVFHFLDDFEAGTGVPVTLSLNISTRPGVPTTPFGIGPASNLLWVQDLPMFDHKQLISDHAILPDGIGCRALDPGIEREVHILADHGVETFESCEGGDGHSFLEPTIRFHGTKAAGFHALAIALEHGLGVKDLRRVYNVEDGELVGPTWELTFHADRLLARRVELGAIGAQPLAACA